MNASMSTPRTGVFLPSFWEHYGPRSIPQALAEAAAAAEALGIESVWACDHVAAPKQNAGSARCLEPLTLMAWLAQQFPRLRVGTGVLVLPQRNALLVAKQAATLAALTGGRLMLGIGAGWNAEEFRLLGADFERRGAHTDEAIRLMKTLWRGTPVTFEGDFYQLDEAYFYPDPPGDGPPVWIGGTSAAAVSRAARLGDGWAPFWGKWDDFTRDLEQFRAQAKQIRESPRGAQVHIAAFVPLGAEQSVEQVVAGVRAYQDAGLQTVLWNIQATGDMDAYLRLLRVAAEEIQPALGLQP